MIITCYECSAEVSDLAAVCPKCGAPLGKNAAALSDHKNFVNEVFGRMTEPRQSYGDEAVEKVLSMAKDFARLDPLLRSVTLSMAIRKAFFKKEEDRKGLIRYTHLDLDRYYWNARSLDDAEIIKFFVKRKIVNFMREHIDAVMADSLGCRDLLIDIFVRSGWYQLRNCEKGEKVHNKVREYMRELRASAGSEDSRFAGFEKQLILLCDNAVRESQLSIIRKLQRIYRTDCHYCSVCHKELVGRPNSWQEKFYRYSPGDCGEVEFVIDMPRCRECTKMHEQAVIDGKRLDLERDRLGEKSRQLSKSLFVLNRSAKKEELKHQAEMIWDKISDCIHRKVSSQRSEWFSLLDEIDVYFPEEENRDHVMDGDGWYAKEYLNKSYTFALPQTDVDCLVEQMNEQDVE